MRKQRGGLSANGWQAAAATCQPMATVLHSASENAVDHRLNIIAHPKFLIATAIATKQCSRPFFCRDIKRRMIYYLFIHTPEMSILTGNYGAPVKLTCIIHVVELQSFV